MLVISYPSVKWDIPYLHGPFFGLERSKTKIYTWQHLDVITHHLLWRQYHNKGINIFGTLTNATLVFDR